MITSYLLLVFGFPLLMGLPSQAGSLNSLSRDEAAIATHIKSLRDGKSETRSAAAKALRLIVAKYPSQCIYIREKDGGKAGWSEKVNQIKPGMTRAQVLKILPPFAEAPDRMNMASGQRNWDMYRLDYHWTVSVLYDNPDTVSDRPTLIESTLRIHVEPPKNFTGTWITWHVNGQKSYETQYQNGKYNGTHISFHDNGQKMTEQHYKNHVADGAHSGWHRDGKKSYTGQYRNGKQDGTWLHWHDNGRMQSEVTYKNGEYDGVYSYWQDNGQLTSLKIYRNGIMDGLEASWSKEGVLQYKRFYQNGSIVHDFYP